MKKPKYAYQLVAHDYDFSSDITLFHNKKYYQSEFENIVFEAAKKAIDIALPEAYKTIRRLINDHNESLLASMYRNGVACGSFDWSELIHGVADVLITEYGFVKEDIVFCATVGDNIYGIDNLFDRDHKELYQKTDPLEHKLRHYMFKAMYDADIKE